MEVRLRSRSGDTRDVEMDIRHFSLSAFGLYTGENFVGTHGVARDITERRYQETKTRSLQQVRSAVWNMHDAGDIQRVLESIRGGLDTMRIRCLGCAVHVIDMSEPPTLRTFSGRDSGDISKRGEWVLADAESVAATIVEIWRHNDLCYRADLQSKDTYNEKAHLKSEYGDVRAIVDVPFSHGTLSVNSAFPDAFDDRDLIFFQDLAMVLSEGFRRVDDLEHLAVSEARYRSLVETSDFVVMLVRPSGPYLFVSPQVTEWIGYDPEDFYVDSNILSKLLHADDLGAVQQALELAVRERTVQRVECRWLAKNGEYRWSAQVILPVSDGTQDEDLNPIGTLQIILQDITTRKRAEKALESARDHLELQVQDRTRELTQTVEELQRENADRRKAEERSAQLEEQLRESQKLEAVGQLTAGISHNFNNILMIIMGNAELAAKGADETVRSHLKEIERSSLRGAEMVSQLMTFSHRRSPRGQSPVDVGAIVQNTVDICRRTFDRKIHIDFEPPAEPVTILADSSEVQQVILNLCLNARDALEGLSKKPLQILLTVKSIPLLDSYQLPHPKARPGTYAQIGVSDNGIGMDEATQQRVFEPFFSTKDVGKGTGLGLATAYAVVDRCRGWFEVSSRPGAGAQFHVYLPVSVSRPTVPDSQAPPAAIGGNETILVVDDEKEVRAILSLLLEKYGYRVICGVNGEDGLELFKQERDNIDVVLLDLVMPEMSGQEVLEEIIAIDPDARVVISTGFAADDINLDAARGLVQKPYRTDEVLASVRAALEN
jgi:PAS domain S-box-containing protein